jgi:Fic family protein
MTQYLWQTKDWPAFIWDSGLLSESLGRARKTQGMVIAQATSIGLETQAFVTVAEAFTTSAIEGEKLDRDSLRSSVARRLGIPSAGKSTSSSYRKTDGLVEMLHDATHGYQCELTAQQLHGWQAGLFPHGFSGIHKVSIGRWRAGTEPMRVVSGSARREKIHYEAPPSSSVAHEMSRFLEWYNAPPQGLDGMLRAAVAHFWFVSIHPYEDGNGRLARALTDRALAQDEKTGIRLYSLSSQINIEHAGYYEILERCQKQARCDITPWLAWFLGMSERAFIQAKTTIDQTLGVAQFWQAHSATSINERQRKVLKRVLEAPPRGVRAQ